MALNSKCLGNNQYYKMNYFCDVSSFASSFFMPRFVFSSELENYLLVSRRNLSKGPNSRKVSLADSLITEHSRAKHLPLTSSGRRINKFNCENLVLFTDITGATPSEAGYLHEVGE